jgi:site-specific DNA recombinase
MSTKGLRCAIYTRKSHTEGLDQAFNSLDAQREAGVDYVKSQKHEGWVVPRSRYDDGGYSGGTMQRPAIQQLLGDIECGAIDVVVVHKVDRLSRSLGDFAQMMQRFDQHGVSFVSVTQQFNTTTSMGRLTLNMLLSFAQFEREITGEWIRDKITATKKKGMWVCGQPPLGYRLAQEDEERKLYVVADEAELVRTMFVDYLKTPSLVKLAFRLNAAGHTTKRWRSKAGRWHGGQRLTTKYIHRVLTNSTYLGKIAHTEAGKTKTWPALHEAIVDQGIWDQVHQLMERENRQTRHRWT